MPLLRNENPNSTNGTPFIINALIFLCNAKAFLMNGNPNSRNGNPFLYIEFSFLTNGYSFVIVEFSFLCNTNSLAMNGNPNSMEGITQSSIDSGSMIGFFAEFVEIGEARFCPDTFLQVVFSNLSKSGFDGLEVAFRIEELLAEGCQPMSFGLLNFGEFCVDDSDRFGFGSDVGMLGLELGEEGL
jgi:hypothetical protein